LVSVMVTIVLLNVALMWATPLVTPLRIFFFAPAFAPVAVLGLFAHDSISFCADRSTLRSSPRACD